MADDSECDRIIVCDCVVCVVLKNGFSTQTFEAKRKFILKGRPTPELPNLLKKTLKCTRHFQTENYEKFSWLTGCPQKSALFCWPCLLFSKEKSVWNKSGFSDLTNLSKLLQRHSISKTHGISVLNFKTFGKTQRMEFAFSESAEIQNGQYNEKVKENRLVLKRLIDVTCFLAEHELAFHGHDESQGSQNRGNYKDLVRLLAKYDETLKNHIETSTVFQCTATAIQNDLIESIETVVLNRIKKEIEEAPFVAYILDEPNDIHQYSPLSTVFRYISKNGDVCERFIGFQDVSESKDVESLMKIVEETVQKYNFGEKFVAQSYNGASVMSGRISGLQTRVEETYPFALFVHCMAHRLNLVLQQATSQISSVKLFFSHLQGFLTFFSKSSIRCRALDDEVNKRLPKPDQARWNSNSRLVQTIHDFREPLIIFYENITENGDKWDLDTINQAFGFLNHLKDFNFNFLLLFFTELFSYSEILFDVLQKETSNIDFCVEQVEEFCAVVASKRDKFDIYWDRTQKLESIEEPMRKRVRIDSVGDIKSSHRHLFIEIINTILQHMNDRFGNFAELKFLELSNFSENESINESAFESLKKNYGRFFDLPALRSGLSAVYECNQGLVKKGARSMWHSLKTCGLDEDQMFAEVLKLCELAETVAPTSTSAESSFSALKRIKNHVRNTSGPDRTSHLSLLSIEKALVQELRRYEAFYDDVINEFAKKERRIPLLYK